MGQLDLYMYIHIWTHTPSSTYSCFLWASPYQNLCFDPIRNQCSSLADDYTCVFQKIPSVSLFNNIYIYIYSQSLQTTPMCSIGFSFVLFGFGFVFSLRLPRQYYLVLLLVQT